MNPTLRGGAYFGLGIDGNGSLPPLRKWRQAKSTILPGRGAASGASREAGLSSDHHQHDHQQQQKPQDGDVGKFTRDSNKRRRRRSRRCQRAMPASLATDCASGAAVMTRSGMLPQFPRVLLSKPSRLRLRLRIRPARGGGGGDSHRGSTHELGGAHFLAREMSTPPSWTRCGRVRRVSATRALRGNTTTDSKAGLDVTAVVKRREARSGRTTEHAASKPVKMRSIHRSNAKL
jgi:hypothetical protein